MLKSTFCLWDSLVVVVEVEQRGGTIGRARQRLVLLAEARTDAPDIEHGVEGGTAALCLLVAVGGEGLCHGWFLMPEALRCPYQEGHMQLVLRSSGRSMKEELVTVVEDVLAMVARIEHGAHASVCAQALYHPIEHKVGVADGVVVGVDEVGTVLLLGLAMRVGLEMRHLSGIAVHVVEVRAIGVEHDELLLALLTQYLVEDGQQVGVIVVAVLARGFGQLTASGVGIARLEEEPLVGLFAQEVDERVVGALIAQKHGVEACLTECLQDAFLVEETLEVGGRSLREEHGHTLVGGVRLGGDIAERHQSRGLAEPWIGVALITIETEVHGSCRLAYHHDVDLTGVLGMGRLGIEAETGRCLLVVDGGVVALHGKVEVIEHVDGVEVVEHAILWGMMVVGCYIVLAFVVLCIREIDRSHTATAYHGYACCPLTTTLSESIRQHRGLLAPYGHHAQDEQGQIEDEDTRHARNEVVEQLHGLARIGGYEVEEHIHGYDALAEEIEQHDLESRKEDDGEEPPHHLARLARDAHQSHVDTKGQHDVGKGCPCAEVLGETKGHIGHGKRDDGIPVYDFVE